MRLVAALYDPENEKKKGQHIFTTTENPEDWNKKNWGIFWTVNSFTQPVRKKEFVKEIVYWAIDIDKGTKKEMLEKIRKHILPTMVVETKRGYQVYWEAKDAKIENWNKIVWDRLLFYFGADNNAKDVTRLLRYPGFYHCKDPSDKFLIKVVWENNSKYTEDEMLLAFPLPEIEKEKSKQKQNLRIIFKDSDDLWERVWSMNCLTALERISGHPGVGGEVFTFTKTSNGKHNIEVNGKTTSCWVDREGRIGSLDKGGPTIFQWINWYQRDKKRTIEIMKGVFPELWNKN